MCENYAKPQDSVSMPTESTWKVCKSEGFFLPLNNEWKLNYSINTVGDELISHLWLTQLPLNSKSDVLYIIKAAPIFTGAHNICHGVLTKINHFLFAHLSFNHPVELELEDSETLAIRLINERSKEKKTEEYILKLKMVNK